MRRNPEKVEYISWLHKMGKASAVGFVVGETKSYVILCLTKSYGKMLDQLKIARGAIFERKSMRF